MQDLIVSGGMALTMDASGTIVENSLIRVRAGKIVSIESPKSNEVAESSERIIDAKNCLVLPGLINAHTHCAMTLFRGLAEDVPLESWLSTFIFPAEQKFATREFVYTGTLLSALEMIRSGTTMVNDMYYFEEETARALHEAGMRGVCGYTFIEHHPNERATSSPFEAIDHFLDEIKRYPSILPAVAPHAVYSLSEKTFLKVMEFAHTRNLRIHLHLAETVQEVKDCQKLHGKTQVQYLDDFGFWKEKVIAAHAAALSDDDIAILGRNRVGISHNPESNLKLGNPIASVQKLKRAGAYVGLGTDSAASNNNLDLLQEVDFAAKLQAYVAGPGAFSSEDAVRMMTSEGARALGVENEVGSLEVGKSADLIVLDLNRASAVPLFSPYSHVVYSASGAEVRHSVIQGKVVMENFRVLTLDESAILKEARAWGKKISAAR